MEVDVDGVFAANVILAAANVPLGIAVAFIPYKTHV
jgi:hypothetical protein